MRPMLFEFHFERRDQIPRLLVDRTLSIEMIVMFRHGEHPLPRYISSAQHIFEEGNYICTSFRPAKGNH